MLWGATFEPIGSGVPNRLAPFDPAERVPTLCVGIVATGVSPVENIVR